MVFEFSDLFLLAALFFIEIALSADNAIVLGVLTHALPAPLRNKALYIGVGSAFFLRAGALFIVSWILSSAWLELLGAAYLLYLALSHFLKKTSAKPTPPASFWKTVFLIEFFDLAFALDSIIAGVAFIANPSKLWIVYAGGMLGLLTVRYAAHFVSRLIDRFPRLSDCAYLLIILIAVKLALSLFAPMPAYIFWPLFALILLFGFLKK